MGFWSKYKSDIFGPESLPPWRVPVQRSAPTPLNPLQAEIARRQELSQAITTYGKYPVERVPQNILNAALSEVDFPTKPMPGTTKVLSAATRDVLNPIRAFASRTRKYWIGAGIGIGAIGAINLFSGRDDSYNSIEGLRHGGLAEYYRRQLTDFGSGYDPIRALVKTLAKKTPGLTFESLIKSKEWKTALEGAEFVRELGQGLYGKTFLKKGMFRGTEFEFVEKQYLPSARVQVEKEQSLLKKAGAWTRENEQAYLRALSPKQEAKVLSALGETPASPSFYGRGKQTLYMEYMPGKSLSGPTELTERAISDIQETFRVAAEKGIAHGDIREANILVGGERGAVIDWGVAYRNLKTERATEYMAQSIEREIPGFFPGLRVPKPKAIGAYAGPEAGTGGMAKRAKRRGKVKQVIRPGETREEEAFWRTRIEAGGPAAEAPTVISARVPETTKVSNVSFSGPIAQTKTYRSFRLARSAEQLRKDQMVLHRNSMLGGKLHTRGGR